MKKENYLNFDAFRKALYDGKLSERARLVYIHLLQKSSSKGCAINSLYHDIELTKELIAIDLGILTKTGEPSIKLIQRALDELQELDYIKKFQKYKSKGCPLTIRLNFSKEFLKQNGTSFDKTEDENESSFDKSESGFVHHYNPSLNLSNPSLSCINLSNPSLNLSEAESNANAVEDFEESLKAIEEDDTVGEAKDLIDQELYNVKTLQQLSAVGGELRKFISRFNEDNYSELKKYFEGKVKETSSRIKQEAMAEHEASLPF